MRVAGIRYINALPLLYGLSDQPSVDLILDTPSNCYKKLTAGDVDAALIPVMGLQTDPSLRAVKGLGIAALQRTESVYLFSTKPPVGIRTVCTDPGSLTSVALLKIILQKKYGCTPAFQSGDITQIHEALRQADAALIIGDEAILAEKTDYDHYDLATEWYSITRLPLVFAVWACRRPLQPDEEGLLRGALDAAMQNEEGLIRRAQQILNVDLDFLKRYYMVNLHYRLAKADYEGLLMFLSLAVECGVIEKVRKDIWA